MVLVPARLSAAALGLAVGLLPSAAAGGAATPASPPAPSVPPTGWRWPLDGVPVIARPFQAPPSPWAAGHRGVDLAAPPAAPVLAAGSGVVSFAGYVAGTGVVAVAHLGGLRTTYEPVAPLVRAGQRVMAGQQVGRLLAGHGDCGPGRWCLHWGLLRGSTYLDPLTLVRRGPVRLLPLSADPAAAPVTEGAAGQRAGPAAAIMTPSLRGTAGVRDRAAEGRSSGTTTTAKRTTGKRTTAETTAATATATMRARTALARMVPTTLTAGVATGGGALLWGAQRWWRWWRRRRWAMPARQSPARTSRSRRSTRSVSG